MGVPFTLDNDASDSELGAVLYPVQSGKERIITIAARALSNAERNYSTSQKEPLALAWAAELFKTFLYMRKQWQHLTICMRWAGGETEQISGEDPV